MKDNIYLADQDEIIQNDKKVAETLNIFFENAVSCLNLKENSFIINKEHKNIPDPIEKIIIIYQFHPIVWIINSKIKNILIILFVSIT